MKANEPQKNSVESNATGSDTMVIEGNGIGEVKIHENVIASLVRRATLGVEGVSRLSGNALVDNLAEIVGSRRMQSRAISISLENDNRVSVEIKVNIKFGYRLPELAEKIQKAVIAEVENTTGMIVPKVDILVQEIEDPEDEIADETAADTVALPLN